MTSNDNGSRLKWKVLTKTRQSSVRPTGKESLN